MAKKPPDLLHALLQRQKAQKAESAKTPVPAAAPPPPPPPPKVQVPPPPPSIPTPMPKPGPMPVAAPIPKPASLPIRFSSSAGIEISFPTLLGGGVAVIVLLIGAFFLGKASGNLDAGPGETLSTRAPSVSPFQWNKAFTVQAIVLGTNDSDRQRLRDLGRYLGKAGVVASPVEITEGASRRKLAALFVGGADRADEQSLVKLRDWLRALPGQDGSDRPFQSAEIREIPRLEKK